MPMQVMGGIDYANKYLPKFKNQEKVITNEEICNDFYEEALELASVVKILSYADFVKRILINQDRKFKNFCILMSSANSNFKIDESSFKSFVLLNNPAIVPYWP